MTIAVSLARTDAEKEAIYRFRYRVYVEELHLSAPGADPARRTLTDALDGAALHHALLDSEAPDGGVVGSLRVLHLPDVPDPSPLVRKFDLGPALDAFPSAAIVTTSRFMLDQRLRHGPAVFRLMETAFDHARQRGARLNYGDCSPHMLPFYEHLGYRRYTRAYEDTAFGYKVPILMLLGDRPRFDRVRSPLARVAARHADDPEARAWFDRTYPAYLGVESAALLPEGVFFDLLASRVATDPAHAIQPLHDLDRSESVRFLEGATTFQATPGDRIIRQGERGDALFVLLAGVADVVLDENPDVPVAVLGAGDPFGEIGFLTSEPRTANVVARAPCEVLVVSGEFLQRFVAKEAAVAAKVLLNLARVLAARLAFTTRRVVAR